MNCPLDGKIRSKICELYQQGSSLNKLSRLMGITIPYVRKALREGGAEIRSMREALALENASRRVNTDQEQEIIRLYLIGFSLTQVTEKTHVARTTVERILQKHDIPRRARGAALKLRAERIRAASNP